MSEAVERSDRYRCAAEGRLRVGYFGLDELRGRSAADWEQVLGLVRFGTDPNETFAPPVPMATVATPVLAGQPGGSAAEVWEFSGTMHSGVSGRLQYRCGGRYLFASVAVDERELLAEGGTEIEALRAAAESAYRALFGALERLGFPHPLRIWHFLSAINAPLGDGERYWHFNSARQSAFTAARRAIRGDVPAASMVGSEAGSPLTVYCIAAKQPPLVLENPRQCAAWAYPARYGPKSPTFARAGIDMSGEAPRLFISGTASIVGHETVHVGDLLEQTRETLRNVRALIDAANARLTHEGYRGARFVLERLPFKVYVRRPEDQPAIRKLLQEEARIEAPILYLKADVCRRELLLEVEASASVDHG